MSFLHSYCAFGLTMNTKWGTGPFIKNTWCVCVFVCVFVCVCVCVCDVCVCVCLTAADLLLFASLVFQGNVLSWCFCLQISVTSSRAQMSHHALHIFIIFQVDATAGVVASQHLAGVQRIVRGWLYTYKKKSSCS